jgi:predicted metal-dependent peptidase
MLHCLWIHFWRFEVPLHDASRALLANIATDIRINDFVKEIAKVSSRVQLPANPPGASIVESDEYGDDSEEVIFKKLEKEARKRPTPPPGDHPGGDGDKPPKGKGKKPDTGKGKKPDTGKGKKPDTGSGAGKKPKDWSKFKSPGGLKAPPSKLPEEEGGDGKSPEKIAKELRNKWEKVQQSIAQQARLKGDFPGNLIEELEQTHSAVDWKSKLLRFVLSTSATDVSEEHFQRRFMGGVDESYEELYLEDIDAPQVENIIFSKDTSGSMDRDWLSQSCSEIQSAMRTVKIKRLWVLDIDTDLEGLIEEYGPNDQIEFSAKGRGGTDFRPPFEWAMTKCPTPPKALVYFTDGHGPFPEEEPPFPTLWMTFGLDPEAYPNWKNSEVIDMRELV